MACNSLWERGVSVQSFADFFPLVVKNASKCVMKYADKVIFVDVFCDKDDEECREKRMNFLTEIPDWNEESDLEDNGIYTWIMFKGEDGVLQLGMTKSYSMFELGTVHNAIAFRNGAVTVHGAGELKKVGSALTYNLASGTFMLKWSKDPCYPELEKIIQQKLKSFLPSVVYDPNPTSYITSQVVTPDEYDMFTKAGFTITLFDNEDACRSALNIDKEGRPFKKKKGGVNPMEGIVRPVPVRAVGMKPQAQLAREQLASQGLLTIRPSSRESGLSALRSRPKSPSLGFGRRRKTRRGKKNRKATKRRL